ncbi:MAG TPA: DegT/DnrJ/EryC1/StrS family aminotransferase [Candidatus Paceibacterota bacterium]
MTKDFSYRYFPPVRGKMGTLYTSRFLFLDIITYVFFLPVLPFTKYIRSWVEYFLMKSICASNEDLLNKKHIFFLDSGTSALFLALKMALENTQKNVYFNPNTCGAVADSVICAGGIPVFLETSDEGLTDLDSLYQYLENDAGALLLTNTYGFFDDWKKAKQITESQSLPNINDLSQVNICSDEFLSALSASEISVLSFGPEKYIAGISGGALIVDRKYLEKNQDAEEFLRNITRMSSDKIFPKLMKRLKYVLTFQTVGTFFYQMLLRLRLATGLIDTKDPENYVMQNNIHPSRIHLSQTIAVLFRMIYYRWMGKKEQTKYTFLTQQIEEACTIINKSSRVAPPHMILRVEAQKRHAIAEFLAKNEFQTTWNYIPLFILKPFRCYSFTPNERGFWQEVIQIPYRFLSKKQLKRLSSILIYANKIT